MAEQLQKSKFLGCAGMSRPTIRLLSLGLIVAMLGFASCEDDIREEVVVADVASIPSDSRLVGNMAYVYMENPDKDGEPYTQAELAELEYLPATSIAFDIVMKLEPLTIQVLTGDNEELMTIDPPQANENNEYVAAFESHFDDLGFKQGEQRSLSFVITYNNASEGVEPSVQTLDHTFQMANIRPRALAFLVNHAGDTLEIRTKLSAGAEKQDDDTFGSVLTFDTDGENMELLTANPSLDFRYAGDFSISQWINTTSDRFWEAFSGDKDWDNGGSNGFVVSKRGSSWCINVSDGEGNRADVTSNGPAITDGEWHLLTATFDRDGDVVIYQDGAEVGRTDMSSIGNIESGLPFNIGDDGAYKYPMNGKSGAVYVFDYVLASKEVATHANVGGKFKGNIVGQWKFDDPADLTKATIGADLQLTPGRGTDQTSVPGIAGADLAVKLGRGTSYNITHGFPAEGLQDYSVIMDVSVNQADAAGWVSLWQTISANDGDGRAFVSSGGNIWNPTGGSSSQAISWDTWHRVVITCTPEVFRVYVDGEKFKEFESSETYYLGPEIALLFADNNGEDGAITTTEVMLLNTGMPEASVMNLSSVGMPVK